jgi:RHS repeat-associated protein
VETANGGTYTQYIYRPSGDKLGAFRAGAIVSAAVPLPGGMGAVYNAGGLNYIRHMDYLGSSRLATTWAHTVYAKESYAPFGEPYNEAGTQDRVFTGQTQDTTSGVYDYLFRKYDPTAGRWLSPDPAGWSSVDQTNPQSINRYAYVLNNPMVATDPMGLSCYISSDNSVQDDGDGNGCAYYDDNGNLVVVAPDTNQYKGYNYVNSGPVWIANNSDGILMAYMTLKQFTDMMQQSGFYFSDLDQGLANAGKSGHTGIQMRQFSNTCTLHVNIDPTSGQNGQPVRYDFHMDLFNPNPTDVTAGVITFPAHIVEWGLDKALTKMGVPGTVGDSECGFSN